MLDLYLIRHAESELNRAGLINGRSDWVKLAPEGFIQAELLGKRLAREGVRFNEIYSSTSTRAVKTAEIVCQQLSYPLENIVKNENLLELSQGEWEGKPRKEVYTPEVYAEINANNWDFKVKGGESQREVEERIHGWLKKTLLSKWELGLTVGVFTHGMATKCLLRGIMEFTPKITYKIRIGNTSITRLKYDEFGWHLFSLNDVTHLYGRDRDIV